MIGFRKCSQFVLCVHPTFEIGGSADVSGTLTEQWELVAAACDEARVEPGGRAGSRW